MDAELDSKRKKTFGKLKKLENNVNEEYQVV